MRAMRKKPTPGLLKGGKRVFDELREGDSG